MRSEERPPTDVVARVNATKHSCETAFSASDKFLFVGCCAKGAQTSGGVHQLWQRARSYFLLFLSSLFTLPLPLLTPTLHPQPSTLHSSSTPHSSPPPGHLPLPSSLTSPNASTLRLVKDVHPPPFPFHIQSAFCPPYTPLHCFIYPHHPCSKVPTHPCGWQGYTHIEGQGLYVFGGNKGSYQQISVSQTFMIDLSVSWNASDPVFKKLADGPGALFPMITMLSGGEDILSLNTAIGHIYNVKLDSWSLFFNNSLPMGMSGYGATDPESGIVYFTVSDTLYALDPRTRAFKTTGVPKLSNSPYPLLECVWSTSLRSMIFTVEANIMYVYTPSNMNESSHGWSVMNTTGAPSTEIQAGFLRCLLPAYNGSKLVYFTGQYENEHYNAVYILDVATRKWTKGSPTPYRDGPACAVSGDYLIVWGGSFNDTFRDSTIVYNIETNKWVSRYTAPPRMSITTLPASPTSTDLVVTPTSDKKLAIIIGVVLGVLLTTILTAIFIYLRVKKRSEAGVQTTNPDGSSSDTLRKVTNIDIHGKVPTDALPRNPAFPSLDSKGASSSKERKFTVSGVLGLAGARPASEHPHAIVEDPTAKRNAQEGAIEVQPISHHPHAMTRQGPIAKYNDKAELESRGWGDKEELEDK